MLCAWATTVFSLVKDKDRSWCFIGCSVEDSICTFEIQNCKRLVGHFFRPLYAMMNYVLYNSFREFNDIIFLFLPQMFPTSLAWWLKAFIRNLILCHCGQVGTAVSPAPDGSQRVASEWVLRKMPETASCFTSSLSIKMIFQQICFYLCPAQTFPALHWRGLVWDAGRLCWQWARGRCVLMHFLGISASLASALICLGMALPI